MCLNMDRGVGRGEEIFSGPLTRPETAGTSDNAWTEDPEKTRHGRVRSEGALKGLRSYSSSSTMPDST